MTSRTVAMCLECMFSGSGPDAERDARAHAETTGHVVEVKARQVRRIGGHH